MFLRGYPKGRIKNKGGGSDPSPNCASVLKKALSLRLIFQSISSTPFKFFWQKSGPLVSSALFSHLLGTIKRLK